MNIQFPGKILLFGEYTVLLGSEALAMPSHHFHGQWSEKKLDQTAFARYIDFLVQGKSTFDFLDTDRMNQEFKEQKFSFEANIPIGYGLGSSGAITAAIYQRYLTEPHQDWIDAKTRLAKMESFFHGNSSGIDPLVSLSRMCIHQSKEGISLLEDNLKRSSFFLVDSQESRSTKPLVELFKLKLALPSFKDQVEKSWVPLCNSGILSYLNDSKDLMRIWTDISGFQLRFMSEMIHENISTAWEKGLEGDEYKLKLCGAGGGGMYLGIGNKEAFSFDHPELKVFEV